MSDTNTQVEPKFQDMKSIQPFSTRDEYLYAMKEDLAEWFNNMYHDTCSSLNALNFIDYLENGVLICEHANNVMRAVYCNSSLTQQERYYVYFRPDARSQSFQARDNISNFIAWCRKCVKVRECLMFETDDLILRKNEKHFILCLLEVARFGSRYGIQVPHLIRLEQEIDDEIKQLKNQSTPIMISDHEELNDLQSYEDYELDEGDNTATNSSTESTREQSPQPAPPPPPLLLTSSSSSSCSSSYSSSSSSSSAIVTVSSLSSSISLNENLCQTVTIHQSQLKSNVPQTEPPKQVTKHTQVKSCTPKVVRNLNEQFNKNTQSLAPSDKLRQKLHANKNDLHTHVNTIANKCTCEHKYPVIKIGEGKYRIGNTQTIVFIRILRTHIMVRVGGGWDTLENYLNRIDPCRNHHHHHHHVHQNNSNESNCCSSEESSTSIGINKDSILLTPLNKQQQHQDSNNQASSALNRFIQNNAKLQALSTTQSTSSTTIANDNDSYDFTDAKLIIKRDTKGKHSIGKIVLATEDNEMNIIAKKSSSKSSQNTSLNSTPSNSSLSLNGASLIKSESLLKNRVRKLIQRIPTPTSSSFSSPQTTRSGVESSSCDGEIEQLLKNTPVYTETNLPPRLLRKYEKMRHSNANSETSSVASGELNDVQKISSSDYDQNDLVDLAKTIQDIYKIDDIIDLSPQSLNNDQKESPSSSRLNSTSSPKAPPRTKNRYRKSKTTDLKKLILIDDDEDQKNNIFTTPLKSPPLQFDDSLESGNEQDVPVVEILNEEIKTKKEDQKYTFSLNYLTNDKSKYLKYIPLNSDKLRNDFEDDSLNIFNHQQNSNYLEVTQSQTHFTRQFSRRAKWDKSQQKLELAFHQTSDDHLNDDHADTRQMHVQPIRRDFSVPAFSSTTPSAKVKPIAAVKATPKQTPSKEPVHSKTITTTTAAAITPRKQQAQIDVAKQRLYEMKKSLDAKTTTATTAPMTPSKPHILIANAQSTRTTPRKIKKRSGERSQTEAIVSDDNHKPILTQRKVPSRAPTPTKSHVLNVRSSSAHSVTTRATQQQLQQSRQPQTDDSLNDSSRKRADSLTSNTSSTNTAFSLSNEYKENKAYELRKIANLKNRIEVKKMDPIYSRSHPICSEIIETSSEQTRKRLFIKKDEANASFVNSTNTIECSSVEREQPQKLLKKSPTTIKVPQSHSNFNFTLSGAPIKSKSSCDLFYSLKRTNSQQDLLDLMSNGDAPKGDLEQYKIMKSECEKLERLILKQRTTANKKPSAINQPQKPRQLKAKYKRSQTQNLAEDIDKMNRQQSQTNVSSQVADLSSTAESHSQKQKRSSSLPSYVRIPIINIVDHDEELMDSKNVQ